MLHISDNIACCLLLSMWCPRFSILFHPSKYMSAEHIHFFLQLRDQIKLYHWQTYVYSRHIATDTMLEKIEKNMDSFVEIYIGKYGRPKVTGKNAALSLQNLTEAGAKRLLTAAIRYIQGPLTKSLNAVADADLLTIRDELLGNLGQLGYLFTLH